MRFLRLKAWKRSARLSATLYRELGDMAWWSYRDQVTRAGLSVPSNIAEGNERETAKERARYFVIARASCGELVTQLYIGVESGIIDRQQGLSWVREAKQISYLLTSMIRTQRRAIKKESR
jgi:four helix bundle protein